MIQRKESNYPYVIRVCGVRMVCGCNAGSKSRYTRLVRSAHCVRVPPGGGRELSSRSRLRGGERMFQYDHDDVISYFSVLYISQYLNACLGCASQARVRLAGSASPRRSRLCLAGLGCASIYDVIFFSMTHFLVLREI